MVWVGEGVAAPRGREKERRRERGGGREKKKMTRRQQTKREEKKSTAQGKIPRGAWDLSVLPHRPSLSCP